MAVHILRGTSQQWELYKTVILGEGVPAYNFDTLELKVGDGVHTYEQLTAIRGICDSEIDWNEQSINPVENRALARLLPHYVTTAEYNNLLTQRDRDEQNGNTEAVEKFDSILWVITDDDALGGLKVATEDSDGLLSSDDKTKLNAIQNHGWIASSTAPSDTHVLWIDLSQNGVMKYYNNGWKAIASTW